MFPPNPEGTLSPEPGEPEHGVQGPSRELAVKIVNGTTSLTIMAYVPFSSATTWLLCPWCGSLPKLELL